MGNPTDEIAVGPDLRSVLDRLTVDRDGAEYILARPDLEVYVAVPHPGVVLIEALRDGASLAAATARASDAAGEEVDGADFLTGLRDAGLLVSPGGTGATGTGAGIGWVERIPQAAVKPLFGRVAWGFYLAAAVAATVVLMVRPDLRPIFDDVWFLTNPVWSALVLVVASIFIAGGHEWWHRLAGRALGVPGRFRVSRRGVFVVFETDLSRLVTLPRRARYSPLFAGYAFDIVLLAVALLLRLGFREEIVAYPPAFDRFLGAVVFRQLVVLVWQLAGVAFRSDTYAILATALGCHNLYRATALTVKYGARGLDANEAAELASMSPRDRSSAKWFWLVYVAGGLFMFWVLFTYLVPFTYGMIEWVWPNVTAFAVATMVFWESLALVALLVAQFAVIPLIARLERRRDRRSRPASTAAPDPRTVQSPDRLAWRAMFVFLVIFAAVYAGNELRIYVGVSSDATDYNLAADAKDDSCVPGQRVRLMDFPHVSEQAIAGVAFNSNPPTSGPHYGAAVAPGIYSSYLPPGVTVHAMEHGRVVIHYQPDTPEDVIGELEGIAKRFAHDTVLHPNPEIDSGIALTAWGRIDTMDGYDEERIVTFVDLLTGQYNHQSTDSNEC